MSRKKKNDQASPPSAPVLNDTPRELVPLNDSIEPHVADDLLAFVGVPCTYARFNPGSPVPVPLSKGEPVYEIKLESSDAKYRVDSILYGETSLYFKIGDHAKLVPLGCVNYVIPA